MIAPMERVKAEREMVADATSKNVGDLSIKNAQPVSFNHLTGNFTEALTSTADGGADQTASWGGTPVVRPAVDTPANNDGSHGRLHNSDWYERTDEIDGFGGRLAEKDAAGMEVDTLDENPDNGEPDMSVMGFLNTGDNYGDGTDSTDP